MKDFLKKYWFVTLTSIAFVIGIIFVIISNQPDNVATKQVDGKDVLFSINDVNKTADDAYDAVGQAKTQLIAMKFEDLVVSNAIELNDDQKTEAKLNADRTIAAYKAQLGDKEKAEQQVGQVLRAIGYSGIDGLQTYFENQTRKQIAVKDYLTAHPEIFTNYQNETSARIISHILVLSSEATPTQEQQDKMNLVDESLKTKDFATVAAQFSEDGSASNGGQLSGITTKNSQYVPEFLNAALALKEGEVSGWIKSEYGYHKIMMGDSSFEALSKDSSFVQSITQYDPSIYGKTFMELANKVQLEFTNPETKDLLNQYYSLTSEVAQ